MTNNNGENHNITSDQQIEFKSNTFLGVYIDDGLGRMREINYGAWKVARWICMLLKFSKCVNKILWYTKYEFVQLNV